MSEPLSDIVVVDLTRALAGPHAAMMLGDLGARVIKVERPEEGDDSRGWGPPFVGPDGAPDSDADMSEVSTYFLSCNRNKQSVTCDLKAEEGRALLARLVRHADVLVENFRPGVLDRLGFSVARMHELNPGLVILSITGFGHDGPEGGRAGYDQIAQGEGGLMAVTGPSPDQPTKVGVPVADIVAGMYGAYGALAALHERASTGRGKVVRTSLLAGVVGIHAYQGTRWTVAGEQPEATGNHHPSIAPYGTFRCADGVVQLSVGSEGLWRRFAELTGIDATDSRFATNTDRIRHRDELIAEIERVLGRYRRDYWLPRLAEIGVPAGSVRTLDQVYGWDQTLSQGLLVDVDHPTLGRVQLPGPPLRFDGDAPRRHLPPPTLGQHDAEVRAWLDELDGSREPRAGGAAAPDDEGPQ